MVRLLCIALIGLVTLSLRAQTEVQTEPSDVFGASIFTGTFSDQSFTGFNPDYLVGVGDRITLKLWGAYELEKELTVDAQGNIFLPRVGPVNVLNVRNDKLNQVIQSRVKRVYQKNVKVYANLAQAQPVKVFVTGFVKQPGLYAGMSSDSVLYFLDKAGGIETERGSFLDVRILRAGRTRHRVNLYNFLLDGKMASIQFVDGDTILVGPRRHTVKVGGLVENPFRFEFTDPRLPLSRVLALAHPDPQATHMRVARNRGMVRNVDYYPIRRVKGISVNDGDEVVVTADKRPGTIAVRVEGEHGGKQEFILPYGSTLGTLLRQVEFNRRSDKEAIQLFRLSVKERQKEMIRSSLQSLEAAVLTARSATNEEAKLRNQEAELVLKWIERAKGVEPRGQVILAQNDNIGAIVLENGDVLRVPAKSLLVMVHGEVLFPNAVVWKQSENVEDYIDQSGGFTQSANTAQVLVLHPDGSFDKAKNSSWIPHVATNVQPGDEILVLPKIDLKTLQVTKDITQVMYQLALSGAVVLAL
jgi:protein involved in polysaccharide export with SLBB domain